ncbi:MAG: 2-oxoacid:ferredoxin oxidoreductase subunit beta, partial [Bacteroidales bacterium]|nr:2-oxoacid:ferredoxin oxidoreductase subunit beta [Bacteroidales bacterium]
LPLAIGIIRDVEGLTYNDEIDKQVAEVRAKKGFTCLRDMIMAGETWEVK